MSKVDIIKHPVEKIGSDLKKYAWSAIFESLITMVMGVLLIVWPDTVIKVVTYIVGVFFIVKGAYQVINYFLVKGQNDFFNNNLLSGIISVLVGLTLLLIGEEIAHVFRVVIGIWLIYESLVRINTSIKLHAVNISAWKYVLILALFMLIVGIFITFYSGAVVTLIGWMMVLAGIVGVVSDTMFIQYVNKMADALTNRNKAE
ncbi:DUF308 domain-containing protein [Candidatus Saccharibacteria bacterium]|nr:DUF308 domain-containing protein [Candidatus Saccharibacteria bacterium]